MNLGQPDSLLSSLGPHPCLPSPCQSNGGICDCVLPQTVRLQNVLTSNSGDLPPVWSGWHGFLKVVLADFDQLPHDNKECVCACVRAGKHMGSCFVRHFSPDESISNTSSHTSPTLPPCEANLCVSLNMVKAKAKKWE